MKYEDDTQILEEATKLILKCHMSDYESDKRNPNNSENKSCVQTKVLHALNDAVDDWNTITESEKGEIRDKARRITELAAVEADKKWSAAMTLLGF